jgi:hypothetical protein
MAEECDAQVTCVTKFYSRRDVHIKTLFIMPICHQIGSNCSAPARAAGPPGGLHVGSNRVGRGEVSWGRWRLSTPPSNREENVPMEASHFGKPPVIPRLPHDRWAGRSLPHPLDDHASSSAWPCGRMPSARGGFRHFKTVRKFIWPARHRLERWRWCDGTASRSGQKTARTMANHERIFQKRWPTPRAERTVSEHPPGLLSRRIGRRQPSAALVLRPR